MPRPRSFDPDAALDAARAVFEAHGFEGASVQDLVDATGLSRSSLYGAFGDKQALYLATLDRYGAASRDVMAATRASAPTPLAAVRALLDDAARDGVCFSVNATVGRGTTCAETAQRTAGAWAGLCRTFADALGDAQAAGTLGAARDVGALAQTLAATVYGLRAMQAAGAPAEARRTVAETAFRALTA